MLACRSFPTGGGFVFCCSDLTNPTGWPQHWFHREAYGRKGCSNPFVVFMCICWPDRTFKSHLKDCKASSGLVIIKFQLKLNKGFTGIHLWSATEKSFVRKHCSTFLKMNCFLNSERKFVTTMLIHSSQFPLQFPISKNIMLPFKKKTMDIAFLTLLRLLSIWNSPSCVSCYR